jgi:hypothetical protein
MICTDKRFNGNEPRIRHFGKVKSGEHYSVSPVATLGPTVREFSKFGVSNDFERVSERVSKDFESQRSEQLRRE